ncbi:hypothetical protein YPPY54_2868, partial [Yersinia pestis PY-54]
FVTFVYWLIFLNFDFLVINQLSVMSQLIVMGQLIAKKSAT